jgi:hypothetical protein
MKYKLSALHHGICPPGMFLLKYWNTKGTIINPAQLWRYAFHYTWSPTCYARNIYWKLYICFSHVSLIVSWSLYFLLKFTNAPMNKTERNDVEWCFWEDVFDTEITYMPVSLFFFFLFWKQNYPQPMSFAQCVLLSNEWLGLQHCP